MPDVTPPQPQTPPPLIDAFEDAALTFTTAMRIVRSPSSSGLDRLSALVTATDSFIQLVGLSEFVGTELHTIIEQAATSSNQKARTTARLLASRLKLVKGMRIATDISGVLDTISGLMTTRRPED